MRAYDRYFDIVPSLCLEQSRDLSSVFKDRNWQNPAPTTEPTVKITLTVIEVSVFLSHQAKIFFKGINFLLNSPSVKAQEPLLQFLL